MAARRSGAVKRTHGRPLPNPASLRPTRPPSASSSVAVQRSVEYRFREALSAPVCFGLVAAMGKDLQGYFLARLVAGEGEVLNLAVVSHRRRGVASSP